MSYDAWKTREPDHWTKPPECPHCDDAGCPRCCDLEPVTLDDLMTMDEALAADGEKLRQLTGEEHGPFCDMCGEPMDGRDHSGCEAAYPETLR